ncbi:hypothetical protein [Lignipirellula cremea]|uniref:Cytochrome c domain-containing protein n=1 Tax=Lignipirellula cremea TaxID=2528010 RepID=A0A518E413_9BACT|nr:hypothetical protein [Lignipirellula cremea]QDU98830.1 hypothetical protein Pla8534_67410 [Lignipirellula cremea]
MRTAILLLLLLLGALVQPLPGQELLDFEVAPIFYSRTPPENEISRLQDKIDSGSFELDNGSERLPALLRQLGVSPGSQLLVFSKTSAQRSLIGPQNPRAIYFSDDAYVSATHGGYLELIVPDEKLGLAFYRLDQEDSGRPEFSHQVSRCMTCHASTRTRNIPGLQARSLFVDPTGQPVFSAGSFRTSQASPLPERWGGWYVTGRHGETPHLGNFQLPSSARPTQPVENKHGVNLTDLSSRIDTSRYLTPHSDIVALLVFEHQIDVHNQLSRVQYAWRIAQDQGKPDVFWQDECEALLHQMLFLDEAELPHAIEGTSNFAQDFAALGPFDSQQRSLRDFNLKTRLFEFPCSYMIYSQSFQMLPQPVKQHLYLRLAEVLLSPDPKEPFDRLTKEDRCEVGEILRATRPELAKVWEQAEKLPSNKSKTAF